SPSPHSTLLCLSFQQSAPHRNLHSFPTRRSSDLDLDRERSHRSHDHAGLQASAPLRALDQAVRRREARPPQDPESVALLIRILRSEEHTSELQSRFDLVCRLLLEKKNN